MTERGQPDADLGGVGVKATRHVCKYSKIAARFEVRRVLW